MSKPGYASVHAREASLNFPAPEVEASGCTSGSLAARICVCTGKSEMIERLCCCAAFGVEEALARTDGETECASSSYCYGTRSARCLKPTSPIRTENGLYSSKLLSASARFK